LIGRPLRLTAQALAVALAAALLALLVWRVAHDDNNGVTRALASGEHPTAPGFQLKRLDGGGTFDIESIRGKKPIVLDFWASWCVPCIGESKRLTAAHKRYGDRIAFIGVDSKDFAPDARRWQRDHGVTYPSLHDGDGKVLSKYGGLPIPRIFFIGRDGKVIGQLEVEEDLPRYLRQIAES
jgi:cytochrome c biogenesis protein CcmG, thiol:disulfide interchange protein DsbE